MCKKRLMSVLLSVCILVNILSVTAFAKSTEEMTDVNGENITSTEEAAEEPNRSADVVITGFKPLLKTEYEIPVGTKEEELSKVLNLPKKVTAVTEEGETDVDVKWANERKLKLSEPCEVIFSAEVTDRRYIFNYGVAMPKVTVRVTAGANNLSAADEKKAETFSAAPLLAAGPVKNVSSSGIKIYDYTPTTEYATYGPSGEGDLTGKIVYDSDAKTITLDGANITAASDYGIYIDEDVGPVTIILKNKNRVEGGINRLSIYNFSDLTITGEGSLRVRGICAYMGNITIKDTTVEVYDMQCDVSSLGYLGPKRFAFTADNSVVSFLGENCSLVLNREKTLNVKNSTLKFEENKAFIDTDFTLTVINDNSTFENVILPMETGKYEVYGKAVIGKNIYIPEDGYIHLNDGAELTFKNEKSLIIDDGGEIPDIYRSSPNTVKAKILTIKPVSGQEDPPRYELECDVPALLTTVNGTNSRTVYHENMDATDNADFTITVKDLNPDGPLDAPRYYIKDVQMYKNDGTKVSISQYTKGKDVRIIRVKYTALKGVDCYIEVDVAEAAKFTVLPAAVENLGYKPGDGENNKQVLIKPGEIVSRDGNAYVEYSLDEINWSKELPKAADMAEYTVFYRINSATEDHDRGNTYKLTAKIGKERVEKPSSTETVYNGKEQTLTVAASEKYNITPVQGKDAGTYYVTLSLKDKDKTCWAGTDEDSSEIDIPVYINPVVLTAEDFEYSGDVSKTYDGTDESDIAFKVKASAMKNGEEGFDVAGKAVYNTKDVSANKIIFTPDTVDSGNYRIAETETVTITQGAAIKPADMTNLVASAVIEKYYNGSNAYVGNIEITVDGVNEEKGRFVFSKAYFSDSDIGSEKTVKLDMNEDNRVFEEVSGGMDGANYKLPAFPELKGEIKKIIGPVLWKVDAVDKRVVEVDLTEALEDHKYTELKNNEKTDTAEKIGSELRRKLGTGKDSSRLFDVQYQIDGEYFPDEEIKYIMPYPEGTNEKYRFKVAHMKLDGSIEVLNNSQVVKNKNGIIIGDVTASPFLISWKSPPRRDHNIEPEKPDRKPIVTEEKLPEIAEPAAPVIPEEKEPEEESKPIEESREEVPEESKPDIPESETEESEETVTEETEEKGGGIGWMLLLIILLIIVIILIIIFRRKKDEDEEEKK